MKTYKVIAKTRKGGFVKVLKRKLTEAEAKAYVRERDWFFVDHLGRMFDLFAVEG